MVVMAKKKSGRSYQTRSAAQINRPLSGKPQRKPTTPASPTRRALERRSVVPLTVLHRMPRWLIPVIVAVLLLAGFFISAAWAGIFFILVAAFLGWLLALSWPVITEGSRFFRLVVIAVVAGVGIMRLMGIG